MADTCRSCGAAIRWATLPDGKATPLDAIPVDTGNIAVTRDQNGALRARMLRRGETPLEHERIGITHFVTCPDSASHRRGGRT
jgi:hypothetical protein